MGSHGDFYGGETLSLRMQGLPFSATENDVYEFFRGLQIAPNGVVFKFNYDGRPSGICYVTLTSSDQFEQAKLRNRENMGSRYVELFPCSASDIPQNGGDQMGGGMQQGGGFGGGAFGGGYQNGGGYNQGGGFHNQNGGGYDRPFDQRLPFPGGGYQQNAGYDQGFGGGQGGQGFAPGGAVVHMRGLPYRTSPNEICDFFRCYNIRIEDVQIIFNNDGRPSGNANVRFPDPGAAQAAVSQLNRERIGSRWIQLSLEGGNGGGDYQQRY